MADNSPVSYRYHLNNQTTSTLDCGSLGSVTAYSGHASGRNNASMASTQDVGPIPPGTYYIIDRRSGGRLGWLYDYYHAHGWGSTDRHGWFGLYNERSGDETVVDGVRRGNFRLHPESPMRLSDRCITVPDPAGFGRLAEAIQSRRFDASSRRRDGLWNRGGEMRRPAKLAILVVECLVVVLLGNALFHVVDRLPFDMPYGIERVVKGLLRATGYDDLTDPDDMEVIVGTGVAILTTTIAAVLVWAVHRSIRRLARGSARV